MCDKDTVISLDPLSWTYDCAMGLCRECPSLPLAVNECVDLESSVDFTQWKKGPSGRPGFKGSITSLFKVTLSVSSAMENMQEQVINLKSHIYVPYNQRYM